MEKDNENNKTVIKNQKNELFLKVVLSLFSFFIVIFIGGTIFSLVCNSNAEWSEVSEPTIEIDTNIIDTQNTPPYGNGFIADLSEYEEYINPILEKRDDFLLLVNSKNSLKSSYKPTDLTEIPSSLVPSGQDALSLSLYAAKALEAMIIEMTEQGVELNNANIPLTVKRGYISYEEQKSAFEYEVEKLMMNDESLTKAMAEKLAESITERPGTNEHQSGLAVDIHNMAVDGVGFEETEAFSWLMDNSWKFGFILRYRENKSELTGYQFEPWHFRYVGRYHSERIYKLDLCLEEYLEYFDLK